MTNRVTQADVLVLGAGSSRPYNLPIASELAEALGKDPQTILSMEQRREAASWGLGEESDTWDYEQGKAEDFAAQFRDSHSESIDEFLEHRPDLSEQGKRQIAARLVPVESNVVSNSSTRSDWIGWLLSRLLRAHESPEQFPFKVISFNYDRLFEYALASAMSSIRKRPLAECWGEVERYGVFHPYGVLERDLQFRPDQCHFELAHCHDTILRAAGGIRVISEEREAEESVFKEAKRWIATANTIVFLGFGFDETNLRRLGIVPSTAFARRRGEIKIYATAVGLLDAELKKARRLLLSEPGDEIGRRNEGCREFMRRAFDWEEVGWL